MDDKAIEAIVYSVLDYLDSNQNIPYYDEQLKEIQKAIDNMLNAIQQGTLTSSTKQRLEELESRKREQALQSHKKKPNRDMELWRLSVQR